MRAIRIQVELFELCTDEPVYPNVKEADCHEDQITGYPSKAKPVPKGPDGQIAKGALVDVGSALHQRQASHEGRNKDPQSVNDMPQIIQTRLAW